MRSKSRQPVHTKHPMYAQNHRSIGTEIPAFFAKRRPARDAPDMRLFGRSMTCRLGSWAGQLGGKVPRRLQSCAESTLRWSMEPFWPQSAGRGPVTFQLASSSRNCSKGISAPVLRDGRAPCKQQHSQAICGGQHSRLMPSQIRLFFRWFCQSSAVQITTHKDIRHARAPCAHGLSHTSCSQEGWTASASKEHKQADLCSRAGQE